MCKVFALTNAEKLKLTDKFFNVLRETMCKYDNDAFGYAAQGEHGVFGERTTATDRWFKSRQVTPSPLDNMSFIKKEYNKFGKLGSLTGSFIAHSRLSTNDDSLECAHPYVGDKFALIHNGVVRDESHAPIQTVTKNDTEILLRYWEKGGLEAIEDNVSGYYAIAALDKDGYLHIVRDDVANLYMAYVEKLDSHIIATTPEIIQTVCTEMKWKVTPIEKIEDNHYVIFKNNEVVEFRSISTLSPSYVDHSAVNRALGFSRGETDPFFYNEMGYSSSKKEDAEQERKELEKAGIVDVYDHMLRKVGK